MNGKHYLFNHGLSRKWSPLLSQLSLPICRVTPKVYFESLFSQRSWASFVAMGNRRRATIDAQFSTFQLILPHRYIKDSQLFKKTQHFLYYEFTIQTGPSTIGNNAKNNYYIDIISYTDQLDAKILIFIWHFLGAPSFPLVIQVCYLKKII